MSTEFFKDNLHFKEGIKGSYFKKIDGFLYTVDPTDENETILYINLPETDEENKKAIILFLKENIKKFLKARIVKNGIKLTLSADILNKKSTIVKVAEKISAFLTELNISFSDKKHEIDYRNNMYVFIDDSVKADEAEEIEAVEAVEEINEAAEKAPENVKILTVEDFENENEENEEITTKKKSAFLSFFGRTQVILIGIYILCAIVFMALSLISINLAAVSGYLMGWLPSELLVKRKYENKKIFILVTCLSLLTLLLTGGYSLLYMFLAQNEIYTISEFILQSLIPAYCGFNVIFGLLLSMFGTYSTLPAKKKPKVEKDIDFE